MFEILILPQRAIKMLCGCSMAALTEVGMRKEDFV
jgi:hypothetical protein